MPKNGRMVLLHSLTPTWLCWLFLICFHQAWAATPLQPLIDAVPSGGVLQLGAGDYSGPAIIRKALLLDGAGKARLLGGGRGTVLWDCPTVSLCGTS